MSMNDSGQEENEFSQNKTPLDANQMININSLGQYKLLSGKDNSKKIFIRSHSPIILAGMNLKEGKAGELAMRTVDLLEALWVELDKRNYCE